MSGLERALLYATAIQTGLRSSELRSLTRGKLQLKSVPPFILADAARTKNGKPARQYLQPELAYEIQNYVAKKLAGSVVFPMPPKWDVAEMLRSDLEAARSQWLDTFHDAQERTGIEWRLLAAIAYQESQWDTAATSETGVRGFMQITEDTAKRLGISNLLDPGQSVVGAARYLRDLKEKLPSRIHEPERTWLALAAFNIGLGHLEDARILAQKQKLNPDSWSDVKKVLPLLAFPEFYSQAKLGYARGGMPVAFVDRVRGYYDVLLAQLPPHQPRLRMFADAPEDGLAKTKREIVK